MKVSEGKTTGLVLTKRVRPTAVISVAPADGADMLDAVAPHAGA